MLRDVAAATLMPTTKVRCYLVSLRNLELAIGALLRFTRDLSGGGWFAVAA